jgi:hypothetical protein
LDVLSFVGLLGDSVAGVTLKDVFVVAADTSLLLIGDIFVSPMTIGANEIVMT